MRSHLLALALALAACQPHRPPPVDPGPKEPEELARIAEVEDRRVLSDGKLVTWATTHENPQVRARALLALGRVQEPAGLDAVVKGLSDKVAPVRAEAAFAAGLIALSWAGLSEADKVKLADALNSAEQQEADPAAHDAMLEALGRLGTPGAVDRLNERLAVTELQARAALAMGVAFRRGAKLPPSAVRMLNALTARELPQPVRFGAAYALSTSKDSLARPSLRACAEDDASEVRAVCVKGLGEVGEDVDAVLLNKHVDDPDYRVAVEAVRSLAKLGARCRVLACPPLGALADLSSRVERLSRGDTVGGGQVLLALAQQGLPPVGVPVLVRLHEQLLHALQTATEMKVKRDVANLECRVAVAIDRAEGELNLSPGCGGGAVTEARRFSLMLTELADVEPKNPRKRYEQVVGYLAHPDAKVRLAAIQALGGSKWPAAAEKLRPFLTGTDLVLAGAAASALAKLSDKASLPQVRALALKCLSDLDAAPDVADALKAFASKDSVPELNQWLGSPHAFLRDAAAEALTQITGKPVVPPLVERAPADKPGSMPRDATLELKTQRGPITIKLFTQDAPRTCASMYNLARKGFFRNTTFHRIVPDFVAQGGDPRGDGNGGPGYTLRCEVNHHPYLRGAVGMALSGKDTGGSQFFLTLSPQPHLEGRYTVFGEIVKGQEVADQLLEGDLILDAWGAP